MILRLTDTLARKIRFRPTAVQPLHVNAFADWSVHLFRAGRTPFLLAMNTRSLYTVVAPANGIVTPVTLEARLHAYLRSHLVSDGFEFFYRRLVDRGDDATIFSKPLDARSEATLADFSQLVEHYVAEEKLDPEEAARRVNSAALSALNHETPRHTFQTMGF